MSDFYRTFDEEFSTDIYRTRSPPAVPYEWEFHPGSPKVMKINDDGDGDDDVGDFAFEFSKDLEKTSLSADELFDGGKIKPLKPPPSVRSPRSPSKAKKKTERERGRERISTSAAAGLSGSNSGRRAARSVSPLRVSQYPWEDQDNQDQQQQPPQQKVANTNNNTSQQNSATISKHSSSSSSKGSSSSSSRKWRLRDFLLFRSASEGRATDKDPLRKYYALYGKKQHEDVAMKSGSFRSAESTTGARRKGAPVVSAHERHYTANKAASEDLKKKTFLPYKRGILALHSLANGFGSLTRSSS